RKASFLYIGYTHGRRRSGEFWHRRGRNVIPFMCKSVITIRMVQEILSMDVDASDTDTEESIYRLRIGKQVKYVTIEPGTFPSDVLSFPVDLLPLLPHLPPGNWVQVRVMRGSDGNPTAQFMDVTLPEVREQWHPNKVDDLSLPLVKIITSRVRVVQYASRPAIAKIARFDFEIAQMERETVVYRAIDGLGVGPAFLGHIVEGDRVIGFLVEQVH
ncbi:hypothetical protein CY34DRAFT_776654, partial [Suillus luteus UH-Slu-Lm8-n1]